VDISKFRMNHAKTLYLDVFVGYVSDAYDVYCHYAMMIIF
jgi:hypothetical protein